jgi:hypothetical protein
MLFLCLTLVFTADAGSPPKVTGKNWEHHPAVEASRAVFTEVRAAVDAKQLTSRDSHDCTAEFSSFTLATDAKGIVRYFVRDFGGSDSSQRVESYYDAQGRLRFVFVKVGAVPSAWVQARYWLDEAGALVWKARTAGGEGPTYYATNPAEYLTRDPAAYVAARSRCNPR